MIKYALCASVLAVCGCSGIDATTARQANDSALCAELREPVDTWVEAMLDNQEKTPEPVIVTGTRVVKGYDSGCEDS